MLSDNIRKYRKKNNMSQDELAEKLAVTRQSISLWETGQTQPSLDNIVALSKLFNISTDDLLTEDVDSSVKADSDFIHTENTSEKKNNILVAVVIAAAILIVVAVLFAFGVFGTNKSGVDPESTDVPVIKEESTINEDAEIKEQPVIKEEAPSKEDKVSNESVDPPKTNEIKNKDIYGYLKNFVIQNGTINGDYCYYSKTADNYGGYSSEDFSLFYWGDTEKVEFCLHSVIDDTFSINFYLYVPQNHTGKYEYISSYYYRDSGAPLYEAKGTISSDEFTKNYPLNCSEYTGSTSVQNEFMEMSRQGMCDLIDCLKEFTVVENLDYSFADFGFTKF